MKIMSRRIGGDSVNELFTKSTPFLSDIIFISGKHSLLFCLLHTIFFQQSIYQSERKSFETNFRKNLKDVHATFGEVQNYVIARYVT